MCIFSSLQILFVNYTSISKKKKGMKENLSDLMSHLQTWLNKAIWKLFFSQRLLLFNSLKSRGGGAKWQMTFNHVTNTKGLDGKGLLAKH